MNYPQKTPSSNLYKTFKAGELKVGKEYSFSGTPMEGSEKLLGNTKRLFYANFVKVEGGDLKFNFNGMDLYINPSEVNEFTYEGFNEHGGKRTRRNKNKRQRKNTRKNRSRK
jgi:hypothetical protein